MSDSKRCTGCQQVKPLTAFAVRRASPDGLAYRCRDCYRQFVTGWRQANPGKFKEWYEQNKVRRAQYWQAWYAENKEARAASYKAWAKKNPHKVNALIAKRNAAKLRATPPWANEEAIAEFYREAARLTRETGIRHEVDHIVPLQGELVCGLHHEGNLQILTRSENARKRNKYPVETV